MRIEEVKLPYKLDEVVIWENKHEEAAENIMNLATVLYCHMIKYQCQPSDQSASWVHSIISSVDGINDKIQDKDVQRIIKTPKFINKLDDAYLSGLNHAIDETHMTKEYLLKHSENIRMLSPIELADRDRAIKFLQNNYNNKAKGAIKAKAKIDEYIREKTNNVRTN